MITQDSRDFLSVGSLDLEEERIEVMRGRDDN